MEKNIIYILRINPDPNGTLDVDGEKFRVYEEVDPRYKEILADERQKYLDCFAVQLKQTKAQGDPKRNLEIMLTNTLPKKIN